MTSQHLGAVSESWHSLEKASEKMPEKQPQIHDLIDCLHSDGNANWQALEAEP